MASSPTLITTTPRAAAADPAARTSQLSQGDFARGQRRFGDPLATTGDFATGQRQTLTPASAGTFATGMLSVPRSTAVGDFATGMRTGRPAFVVEHEVAEVPAGLALAA